MTTVQESSVFPFAVEPVSSSQTQFWAQYAAQAVTKGQMNIVSHAYYGFWNDVHLFETYQDAVACMRYRNPEAALGYLDLVVGYVVEDVGLGRDVYGWSAVLEDFQKLLGGQASASPWYREAATHVQALRSLLGQVVSYIVSCCAELGCALPKYTAAYLEAQKGQ